MRWQCCWNLNGGRKSDLASEGSNPFVNSEGNHPPRRWSSAVIFSNSFKENDDENFPFVFFFWEIPACIQYKVFIGGTRLFFRISATSQTARYKSKSLLTSVAALYMPSFRIPGPGALDSELVYLMGLEIKQIFFIPY